MLPIRSPYINPLPKKGCFYKHQKHRRDMEWKHFISLFSFKGILFWRFHHDRNYRLLSGKIQPSSASLILKRSLRIRIGIINACSRPEHKLTKVYIVVRDAIRISTDHRSIRRHPVVVRTIVNLIIFPCIRIHNIDFP